MSLPNDPDGKWLKQYYGVDVKVGDRVKFEGRVGTVMGLSQYLHVQFDGDLEGTMSTLHPTYHVEYSPEESE